MPKYEIVKRLYDNGLWRIEHVRQAVVSGWITEAEYTLITGEEY